MTIGSRVSKALATLGAVGTLVAPASARPPSNAGESVPVACPALLNHSFKSLEDGRQLPLCQYTGKVLLVVNTASQCKLASQFKALETLRAKYEPLGFEVLAFPSDDFGQLEPGSEKQIAEYCRQVLGVRFPMFEKTHVVGDSANPLFMALAAATGRVPDWNFHKYLVNRQGIAIASFDSHVTPDAPGLIAAIEKALRTY